MYSNRQLKLFKRIFNDFIREYTLITNIKIKAHSVNHESVSKFVSEIKNNFNDYANCNESVLTKIEMLKDLDTSKVKIQWVSLHNLFLIVFDTNSFSFTKEQVISKFESGRKQIGKIIASVSPSTLIDPSASVMSLMPMMAGLLQGNSSDTSNDFMNDPMFADLIQQTSSSLMKSFEGKEDKLRNINPMELFNGLISGKPIVGGIDLSDIVGNLKDSIDNKINAGELNPDQIKNKAENLIKMLPKDIQEKLV